MFYFHEAWDSRETLILVRLFSYSFFLFAMKMWIGTQMLEILLLEHVLTNLCTADWGVFVRGMFAPTDF